MLYNQGPCCKVEKVLIKLDFLALLGVGMHGIVVMSSPHD
jgi:hypothetical protein